MNPFRLGIILLSLATVLSACGGGGSGSGRVPQTGPSSITYNTMVSDVSAILRSSDSLLVTDVLLAHPSNPQGTRIQTSCGLGQCQASYSGYSVLDISLSDFEFRLLRTTTDFLLALVASRWLMFEEEMKRLE